MFSKFAIAGIGLALGLSQTVLADNGRWQDEPGYDYARVVDVEPIVRYVTVEEPRRECWDEVVYREPRRRGNPGAVIAGGIIGGVIGNQFGDGRGNKVATVAGTLLGSAIANDMARRSPRHYREAETVTRCEVHQDVRTEERIDGYRVTYEYLGREYTTRTRTHPGNELAIQVSVTPLGT